MAEEVYKGLGYGNRHAKDLVVSCLHGLAMITSTTSSVPKSIHRPTVIRSTQTSSAQKVAYITGTQNDDRWWRTAQNFLPSTLNPDLFRYLFAFVWRYQLLLTQDFIQALADTS